MRFDACATLQLLTGRFADYFFLPGFGSSVLRHALPVAVADSSMISTDSVVVVVVSVVVVVVVVSDGAVAAVVVSGGEIVVVVVDVSVDVVDMSVEGWLVEEGGSPSMLPPTMSEGVARLSVDSMENGWIGVITAFHSGARSRPCQQALRRGPRRAFALERASLATCRLATTEGRGALAVHDVEHFACGRAVTPVVHHADSCLELAFERATDELGRTARLQCVLQDAHAVFAVRPGHTMKPDEALRDPCCELECRSTADPFLYK
jgi:hypothetical protein